MRNPFSYDGKMARKVSEFVKNNLGAVSIPTTFAIMYPTVHGSSEILTDERYAALFIGAMGLYGLSKLQSHYHTPEDKRNCVFG